MMIEGSSIMIHPNISFLNLFTLLLTYLWVSNLDEYCSTTIDCISHFHSITGQNEIRRKAFM